MFLACLFSYGSLLSAAEVHNSIPAKFQGLWASDVKNCSIDHTMNLTINSESLTFWESSGSVLSVVTEDGNELALIVDFSGEGDEWIGFVHFEISSNKLTLKDIQNSNSTNQVLRYKCPTN